MLRVLLINPPLTHFKGSVDYEIHLPIGLMYIAASIRNVCKVELLDCRLYDSHLQRKDYVIYGLTPEKIRKIITEKQPDIVGISVHSTANFKDAELVAQITKEVNPKIITVFGGPDPSIRFESILQNQYCDYCVVGDGEETFLEFVKSFPLESEPINIKGLAYKRNGDIKYEPRHFDENLDNLPFPSYDLIELEKYQNNPRFYRVRSRINKQSTTLITSRGCPNRCIFCSIRLHMGQKFRSHSPEYVIKLIRHCLDTYGLTNFHFEDDNLTCDKQRFQGILDLIIKEKLNIKWDTPNGVRMEFLDYNILRKMKQAGCFQLNLAIESGNERVLNQIIHKCLDLKKAEEIAKYLKELKIPSKAFYVIGFPGETIKEMKETTKFAIELYRKYDVSPILMIATPLYGTDLYEVCKRDQLIKGDPTPEELSIAIQISGEPLISTSDFSAADIKRVIKDFRRELRPHLIRHIIKKQLLEIQTKNKLAKK